MAYILGVLVFVASVFVLEMLFYAYHLFHGAAKNSARKRVQELGTQQDGSPSLLRDEVKLSEIAWIDRFLRRFTVIQGLQSFIAQAQGSYSLGFYLLLALTIALLFIYSVVLIKHWPLLIAVPVGMGIGSVPFLLLAYRRRLRSAKFDRQLPDALELISRSLRAGHGLVAGMNMVAEEMNDPMGPEFNQAVKEINYGSSFDEAMQGLVIRNPCPDLPFFATAVILQRETGGNLAQIIQNIALLIRERQKFRGKVRALTAEGRLTAVLFAVIPLIIAVIMYFINPSHILFLFSDPVGKQMTVGMLILMAIGILIMRKIIQIRL